MFVVVTDIVVVAFGGGVDFTSTAIGKCYVVLWSIWWVLSLMGRQRGVRSSHDDEQRRAVRVFSAISVLVLVVAPPLEFSLLAGPLPREGYLTWVGVALFLTGLIIQTLAMWTLKGLFTVRLGIQPQHELITIGVYRFIRYPGYTSYILSILGIGFMMSSLITIGLSICVTLFLVWRIGHEERMLLDEFGAAYRAYMESTKRLVPFVY